jgi:hypothetical protein
LQEIRCTFEEDLLDISKAALDRRFVLAGVREANIGRRNRPFKVTRLEILDDAAGETFRSAIAS